ncbi:hypothetical protein LWF15_19955 [Kineosporia rhizophila]|uniref:hypothetical protein n=1 Tax=Kineosporia rhizophila TaxID=84633 RepID=UPI001E58E346|nr:hypothetical protein [Kineosporia rhizophila]MCE0537771.1 hypothetical protein [Kineosporia rhizophila]
MRMFLISPDFYLHEGQACQIGKASLRMQRDGNLVIYDENNRPRWASKTKVPWLARSNHLRFQPDGNLVVYAFHYGAGAIYHQPLWASNTRQRPNPGFRLAVQADGNVVIYDRNWRVKWAAGTHH